MAYTTPALTAINEGRTPIQEALSYAGSVLRAEGKNPETVLIGSELHRHLFAVALDFQQDVHTLRTLAGLAFSDNHLGPGLLESATVDKDAIEIAKDFNAINQQMHPNLSHVCEYVQNLRLLYKQNPNTEGAV